MSKAANVNVQIGATFAASFSSAFGMAESRMGKLGSAVKALDGKLQKAQGFQRQRQAAIDAEGAYRAADQELRSMSQHLAGLDTITDQQARQFRKLEQRTDKLREAMLKARSETDRMGSELREAGVNTDNLTTEQRNLERQLTATTNRFKALSVLADSGVATALGKVGGQFRSLATQATIAGAGVGYFFKRNFIDVASEFERFQTILLTTEGSSAKAQTAMSWISDFAAKTPYELSEVTEAFVKLRAYGLNPTNGLLQSLGDTSAAMGKDVMQAVEAIADAVTGENERLKEFGIKGSKKGGQITYEFTDRAGAQQTRTVDANNRALIESTLTAIFNDKYAGAMDNLSRTWGGMVSNLKDQWARFANNTMNAGLFDWMKGQLGGVLKTLDTMAGNGELQAWAQRTGAALVAFANNAWQLGSAIVQATSWLADFVGGWKNLGFILVGLKLAPLVISLGQLAWALGGAGTAMLMFATGTATAGAAFKALAVAMLGNPIGIAITALSVAGFMLWKNWDGVKGGLMIIWQTIKETAIAAFEAIKTAVGGVIDWLAEKTAWIFATVDKVRSAASSIGGSIGSGWDTAKSWVGLGGDTSSTAAPGAQSQMAPVVPAGRGGNVTQSTSITAPITINGAQDPQAVARAVDEQLRRRERESAAGRRSMMTDPLGY